MTISHTFIQMCDWPVLKKNVAKAQFWRSESSFLLYPDYLLEDIMTKKGIGFMEELHNTMCLNTDMDLKMALMHDMFKWRLQNLQQQEADESESDDMDESLDEDSEEEDEWSDIWILLR